MAVKGEVVWKEVLQRVAEGTMVKTRAQEIEPGDVFVAMPGSRVDGAQFIPEALRRGAAYVIARPDVELPQESECRYVPHPSPPRALGYLAQAHYGTGELPLKIVGITGTNGKTTISYMLEHLFREAGYRTGVIGTVSCRWEGREMQSSLTTPDCWTLHHTIREMADAGVEVVFVEVSSHALHQERVAGISFDMSAFTNLTQDHLDYHASMEEYFEAKRKLFTRWDKNPPLGVVNLDDAYVKRVAQEHRPLFGITMAKNGDSSFPVLRGEVISVSKQGLVLRIAYQNKEWIIESPLVGKHNAYNLLTALAVGVGLELEDKDLNLLSTFSGAPGRLQRVSNDKGLDVFVDYAHTPDALENVLSSLRELDFSRIITVFGCGGERDTGKRIPMGQAVAKYSDVAVLTSDNPRNEDPETIMDQIMPGLKNCPKVIRQGDRKQAIRVALEEMKPGDVLLVAGKGHEEYQQIGAIKVPFSDVQVIQEFLQ